MHTGLEKGSRLLSRNRDEVSLSLSLSTLSIKMWVFFLSECNQIALDHMKAQV